MTGSGAFPATLKGVHVASSVVAVVLLIYAAARAAMVPITIDEALTLAWHVPGSLPDIILLRTPGLEDNNHVLLTLLAKASVSAFGVSEFSLRLPSLLGYALFLAGVYFILDRITASWLHTLGMLAIGLNPYLVDYFTVARGYGLALGLATAGLACLLDAVRDETLVRQRPAYVAFLLFTLAAVAQLTFTLVLIAAVVVFWAPFLFRRQASELWRMLRPRTSAVWSMLAGTVILQAYVIHLALVLRRVGLLSAGEARGFWSGTVGSLVDGTLHDSAPGIARDVMFLWVVVTLLLALYLVRTRQPPSQRRSPLAILMGVLLLVAVGSVLQHFLFGVALLDGRRAIALLPLFLLCAMALPAAAARSSHPARIAAMAVGVGAPILLAVHGAAASNLKYVRAGAMRPRHATQ